MFPTVPGAARYATGMADSADELVTEFCALWADPDPAQLASCVSDDGIYHNMPMPPTQARPRFRSSSGLHGDVRRHRFLVAPGRVADGDLGVPNERN